MKTLNSIAPIAVLLASVTAQAKPIGLSCFLFAHPLQIDFRESEILPSTVSNCQNALYPKDWDRTGIRYRIEICDHSANGTVESRDELGNWNLVKHFSTKDECTLEDDSPRTPQGQIARPCGLRYHCK